MDPIKKLQELFPYKSVIEINLALQLAKGNVEVAASNLFVEDAPKNPPNSQINPVSGPSFNFPAYTLPKPSPPKPEQNEYKFSSCFPNPSHVCNCGCHASNSVHILPCCNTCSSCFQKIMISKHAEHLGQKQPEPVFEFSPSKQAEPSYEEICTKVSNMVSDKEATKLASKYGLNIVKISWEDNARTKESVWGPCISDMTLQVNNKLMPVIRQPNYTDLTWDIPMEEIPLMVGNEFGDELYKTNLKEYLENFRTYLSGKPHSFSFFFPLGVSFIFFIKSRKVGKGTKTLCTVLKRIVTLS